METLEKKVTKVDEHVTEHIAKMQRSLKQLNTTSGKVDKHKVKLSGLESRVSKLEKK